MDTGRMPAPSALSLKALGYAQACVKMGIRGGQPRRFEGPEVNLYLASVDLAPGFPWCAAGVHYAHETCCAEGQRNPCPKTGRALALAAAAAPWQRLDGPQVGATFVVDRGHGRGHCGICEAIGPLSGQVTTVEPDTNGGGSATGDAWGRHTWEPADGERGTLVGWFDFGATEPSDGQ